jgi:PKD repeat protein
MISLIISIQVNSQEELKVLFIGNSYTGANSLADKVAQLADSQGKAMIVQQQTPGGMTLSGHAGNPATYTAMHENDWDYVVIQAQSQEPSFPPAQVANDTYPYAAILADSVRAINPCAEPVFFMTWGRKNGDSVNGQIYPVIATYEGMQWRLRQSYMEMAYDNDATVAPVGAAWQWIRNNYSGIELYSPDESHPSVLGTYLAACVFYSTFYSESPLGSLYLPNGVNAIDAAALQLAAQNIVVDSLNTWRIGANLPTADFSHIVNFEEVTFAAADQGNNIFNYKWEFGDGNSSTDVNPVYSYATVGTYPVKLTIYDDCNTDTIVNNVVVSSLNSIGDEPVNSVSVFPNPFTTEICVMSFDENQSQIELLSISGTVLHESFFSGKYILPATNLKSGIYFIRITGKEKTRIQKLVKR